MANVTLRSLTKVYPATAGNAAFTAVKSVDLTIRDGEFMVLVGPSGCGKSTTLRMIAGLEDISSGDITIGERVVNDVLPKDRNIAMVFQNYALYPHMTVYDNLGFGLKLRKMSKPEIDRRVREVAALLGLETMLDRRPKALSGGQRQRVAVGRAIVRQPEVFLFDEPLSNLDAKMRVSMRAEISRLHHRLRATMIYVTHDQVEAMTMGDRICVMKDGVVMQVAEPIELYNRPANLYVAGFIGSPSMNHLRGALEAVPGGGLDFVGDSGTPRVAIAGPLATAGRAGQRVVLGVRPENITLAPAGTRGLEFTVEVAEPLGAETYLHLRSGPHAIIARVPPGPPPAPGQTVRVHFAPDRLHLFDAATELSLG
jgi:multiple sugar transport system ATP-binding protein